MDDDTQIVFKVKNFALNETVSFTGYEKIALKGEANRNVMIECKHGAGLSFFNSSEISIENMEFLYCGSLQNSTSRPNDTFVPVYIAIYFQFCLSINLTSINITNSSGTGVAIVATGGTNYIQYSGFYNNNPNKDEDYGGGGLQIEFPYCSPEYQSECMLLNVSEYNSNAEYEIIGCVFERNKAVPLLEPSFYQFLPPEPERHVSIGRGGGLGLHFCQASNVLVTINDTSIVNNTAYYGAGISCSFEEYSINNTVLITGGSNEASCSIVNNTGLKLQNQNSPYGGYGAGGGLRTVFWFSYQAHHSHNTLNVKQCHFHANSAYFGGATLLMSSPEMRLDPTNSVSFTRCSWAGNTGHLGGVGLITPYNETVKRGALLKSIFRECSFSNNRGNLVVNHLPIAFQKSVNFIKNIQLSLSSGILTINEATVEFHDNCKANFTHNKAEYGGAITLYGHAFLRVFPNTTFLFSLNYARRDGGAIYQHISEVDIFQNGPCFVQYYDRTVPPCNWNTSFVFDSNQENIKTTNPVCNSMLLGSVVPCMWKGYTYQEIQNDSVLAKAMCSEWRNILEFNSSNCTLLDCPNDSSPCNNCTLPRNNCTLHIHTTPKHINKTKGNVLTVTPGQPAILGLELVDDLGSNVSYESVLNVWTANKTFMNLSSDTFYVTGDSLTMYGTPGSVGRLNVDIRPPRPLFAYININFTHCPPGFIQRTITSDRTNLPTCRCEKGFRGAVTCDGSGNAYLRRGYWIGKINDHDDQYVVGKTAYIYSQTFSETPLPRTDFLDSSTLTDLVCGPLHREGTLCGKCRDGYILPLHSYSFNSCVQCKPHDSYGWILVVVLELIPVTIFLIAVLIFNISATSGAMNFFVFFAQVITNSFSVDAGGYIEKMPESFRFLSYVYSTLYSFWRLDISIPHDWCYTHPIPTPQIFLLVYGQALYTLLLILIFLLFVKLHDNGVQPFYCCGKWLYEKLRRFRQPWTVQRSVIHALATFLVLSFAKIIGISFLLIAPTPLVNHSGETVKWVPLYYGDDSDSYAIFVLVAVAFLAVFALLPMLLLLVIPMNTRLGSLVFDKIFKFLHFNPNNTKLQIFLQVFQGSFKDGSGSKDEINCQKFAGFYLVLRFVIFMLAALFPVAEYLLGQQVIVMAAMVMFAVFQPYRKQLYNILDVLAFAMLAVINLITIYHELVGLMSQSISIPLLALQYFLVFIPLLIMSGVVICKILMYFCGNRKTRSFSFLWRGRGNTETDEDFVSFVTATRDRENTR